MQTMKLSCLLAALTLLGCAADGSTDTSDTDSDTPVTDLCAPQVPSTNTIAESQLSSAYPTPAGGTVLDGTYELVRFEVYAPATADAHTRARRLVFNAGTVVSININDGAPDPIQGGTFSTSGTNLQFDLACPSAGSVTLPYTVSGAEFWLFDTTEPNVQVYTRL